MRSFFIGSFEILITILVVVMCIGVVISALVTMTTGGGFFAGLGILIFGGFYVVVTAGMMYLFLGIHDNTKRTAEALERMSSLK